MASCFRTNQSLITIVPTSMRPQPKTRQTDSTHPILCLLVGAGIQQQSHEIFKTIPSGIHQRRAPVLTYDDDDISHAHPPQCPMHRNSAHTKQRYYRSKTKTLRKYSQYMIEQVQTTEILMVVTATPNANSQPQTRRTDSTHIVRGLLVGAGIQQQPRALHVTIASGRNQRRETALQRTRVCQ